MRERERFWTKRGVVTLAGARGTTERVPLNAEICFTRDRSFNWRLAIRSPAADIGVGVTDSFLDQEDQRG